MIQTRATTAKTSQKKRKSCSSPIPLLSRRSTRPPRARLRRARLRRARLRNPKTVHVKKGGRKEHDIINSADNEDSEGTEDDEMSLYNSSPSKKLGRFSKGKKRAFKDFNSDDETCRSARSPAPRPLRRSVTFLKSPHLSLHFPAFCTLGRCFRYDNPFSLPITMMSGTTSWVCFLG
jgi:hypothetical protein